jgi:acetyl-CoA C-acetyltransferase
MLCTVIILILTVLHLFPFPFPFPLTLLLTLVCSSGMKACDIGMKSILLGHADVVVAGGFENMSQVPYYSETTRFGARMGNTKLVDGMIKDGLWDVYNQYHMGNAGEHVANEMSLDRKMQDSYSIESYERARAAQANGTAIREIVPVSVKGRKGTVQVTKDEECQRFNASKLLKLRPAFKKGGTVTAGNASVLSDGAAALVLISGKRAMQLRVPVVAKILSTGDAAKKPVEFTTAPELAIRKAAKRAGVSLDKVDAFEINEAFSVVALANMKLLDIPHDKVNVYGGAVSIGHPLGCSGARIIVTLINALQQRNGKYGIAGICNGGGGASAIVIERV